MKIAFYVASLSLHFLAPGLAAEEPVVAPQAPAFAASATGAAVPLERILVVPDPEDRLAPTKNRREKFEEALGPGRSARRTVTTWRDNAGRRVECYSHCVINCCVDSGNFTLTGAGFGSK